MRFIRILISLCLYIFYIFFLVSYKSTEKLAKAQPEKYQVLYIEVYPKNFSIGVCRKGTGFIIKSKTRYYLVTNYHVITGRDPDDTTIWTDDDIREHYDGYVVNILYKSTDGKTIWRKENLLSNNKHKFIEYQLNTGLVDVIALPLTDTTRMAGYIHPIKYNHSKTFILNDKDSAFAIGYIAVGYNSIVPPLVRKPGCILSMPNEPLNENPYFLLNIPGQRYTQGGMSGSPVFYISRKQENLIFLGVLSKDIFWGETKNYINELIWSSNYLTKKFNSLP